MYLLKNALKNLGRNKGRNILVGLIMLVIILAVSVSIVINSTVASITKDYKLRFGSKVTLFLDADKAKQYDTVTYPTAKQQMEIAQSDLLQKTEYKCSMNAALQNLEALDSDALGNGIAGIEGADTLTPSVKVLASSDTSISDEFADGTRSIRSGRVFQNPDECIVSQKFAEHNGLNVGDKVTVTSTDEKNLMPYTMTICGIYQDNLPQNNGGLKHPLFHRGNEIITDMSSLMGTELFDACGSLNTVFFLKDPGMLEAFQKEAGEKGLAPYYRVTTDEEAYHRIVGPVEGISKIVTVFLTVVLIFGSAVLLFISIMAVRERKYEIGVLRAMGMKRGRVMAGMVCETIAITAVCLIIGLGASIPLAQPVADTLLKDQIRIAEKDEQKKGTFVLGAGAGEESAISKISVRITPQAMLQIGSLALLLVLISSMAGILYITRFEPMKLLSERS